MTSANEINRMHAEAWAEAAEKYGSKFDVPESVRFTISERTRARMILLKDPDPGVSKAAHLTKYGVGPDFVKEILGSADVEVQRKETIAQKEKKLMTWCLQHVGAQISPETLVEESGFSRSKCLTFIQDNVGMFFQVKRGLYEIRDPKAEREKAKCNG